jgi:hypothetical protein
MFEFPKARILVVVGDLPLKDAYAAMNDAAPTTPIVC